MTSRERVLAAVNHTQPDRVPISLRFAPAAMLKLKERLGMTEPEVVEWIGVDLVTVRPSIRRPASDKLYADPTIEVTPEGLLLDIYRVPFREVRTEYQNYVELAGIPPLREAEHLDELNRYPWPQLDLWDFSTIPAALAANRHKATWARCRGVFEIAHFMRGMDRLMLDLTLNPEFANCLMDHIMECLLTLVRRTLEAGKGEYAIYEYNDDVASQRALLMSPTMWRELIKPRMAQVCKLIHQHGAKVRYHSCGAVYPIIPDLIEIGVDILNPVQPLATNMDPFRLKAEFGDRLTFDGGIDIQHLLVHASPRKSAGTCAGSSTWSAATAATSWPAPTRSRRMPPWRTSWR